MISHTTKEFWKLFDALPDPIRRQARQAFRRFQDDTNHTSLRFKQVHETKPIFSARVNRDYRVLGVRNGDVMVWFWIGSHAEYDKLLDRL